MRFAGIASAGWWAVAAVLAAGAAIGAGAPPHALDWQPALAWSEPWRWVSAAFVHLDHEHLRANLLGLGAVALYGWAAQCRVREAWAWAAAWPLTHLGLLASPTLAHYAGMSGVLHAGVCVASVSLVLRAPGRARAVGMLVLAGLCLKLLGEQAWLRPVRPVPGWSFHVAVAAHLSGSLAGLLTALVATVTATARQGRDTMAR